MVCTEKLITELQNASSADLSIAAWMIRITQIPVMFPNYTDSAAEQVLWPTFAKVSTAWYRKTLTVGLAGSFPLMKKDLEEAFCAGAVEAGGVPVYQLVRKCVVGTMCR